VAGSLASHFFRGGVSVGASGAVFGLLGAALAEMLLRKDAYPERLRRALLTNLIVVVIANVAMGMAVPQIDQAAHLGGLVGGFLLCAVLSPRGRVGGAPFMRQVAGVAAIAWMLAIGASAFAVAATTHDETVARIGWTSWTIGPVSFEAPKAWRVVDYQDRLGAYADPGFGLTTLFVELPETKEPADASILETTQRELEADDAISAVTVESPTLEAPDGWTLDELGFTYAMPTGKKHFRYLLFLGRRDTTGDAERRDPSDPGGERSEPGRDSTMLKLSFILPDKQVRPMAGVVKRVVESVHLPSENP